MEILLLMSQVLISADSLMVFELISVPGMFPQGIRLVQGFCRGPGQVQPQHRDMSRMGVGRGMARMLCTLEVLESKVTQN